MNLRQQTLDAAKNIAIVEQDRARQADRRAAIERGVRKTGERSGAAG